jgi:hypothetical protein
MAEQIIIVVNSDKEKEYGQILKNIISASGVYEAALWTTKHYTDNEPTVTSSQKVIFIGENDVSKRNLSSIDWKFESPNMKYGWIGSVALLTVGNTLLTKEELKNFKQICETQTNDVKKGNIGVAGGIAVRIGATALFGLLSPIGLIALTTSIVLGINNAQKLAKQRKEQYSYLINHFILKNIDNYMVNKK